MIKLVSQFDKENSKVSLATPTCGGCCCCCSCCLVSTLTTSLISKRNFGKIVEKEYPEDKSKILNAKIIGFFLPIIYVALIIIYFLYANIMVDIIFFVPIIPCIINAIYFKLKLKISGKRILAVSILHYLILCILSIIEIIVMMMFILTT